MWIVCGYFTPDYQKHANRFVESLKKFNIPNDVQSINDLGNWYRGMQYKPVFLQQMLKKHSPKSVVYVDVDAEFLQFPDYFDKLDADPSVDIAVHVLDHSKYGRSDRNPELLSGTIFLRNTPTTSIILNRWFEDCRKNPMLWDQRALASVLKDFPFAELPAEYCTIFDYMRSVQNPVIKHFQASREARKHSRQAAKTQQVYVARKKK